MCRLIEYITSWARDLFRKYSRDHYTHFFDKKKLFCKNIINTEDNQIFKELIKTFLRLSCLRFEEERFYSANLYI